jgi:hypothetical protein
MKYLLLILMISLPFAEGEVYRFKIPMPTIEEFTGVELGGSGESSETGPPSANIFDDVNLISHNGINGNFVASYASLSEFEKALFDNLSPVGNYYYSPEVEPAPNTADFNRYRYAGSGAQTMVVPFQNNQSIRGLRLYQQVIADKVNRVDVYYYDGTQWQFIQTFNGITYTGVDEEEFAELTFSTETPEATQFRFDMYGEYLDEMAIYQ